CTRRGSTRAAPGRARRPAQTALWHIAHTLVRLMAPILSFTAEEAWHVMKGADGVSVFEEVWHAIPGHGLDAAALEEWAEVRRVRGLVAKKIEEKRERK